MNTYTEQDIQDYATGKVTGKPGLEEFIKNNPAVLEQVRNYQQLYGLLMTDMPSVSFNLADAVIDKIRQPKSVQEPVKSKALSYAAAIVSVLAVIITWNYFGFNTGLKILAESSLVLLSSVLMIIFLGGFYYLETRELYKKFGV